MSERLGFEQYMTSHLDLAIASIEAALPLWHRVEDPDGLAAAHDSCAVFEYYNAHRRAAEEHAERAIALTDEGAGRAYASARATRAYLAYQRSDFALSEACTRDTLRVAAALGDRGLTLRGSLVAAVRDLASGVPGAREQCMRLIEQARAAGLDELTSTGYSHVSYLDVEHTRLRRAEEVLETSLPFTIERDIPICRHWQTAVRSRLRFREGRWTAALEDASEVLDGVGMPVARFWPLLVGAQVRLRRGEGADLEPAWTLAGQLDEPLRMVPVLAALAERAWLTGVPDARVQDALTTLGARATHPGLRWAVGDLAVWLARLGLPTHADPAVLPEPHRLSLAGDHDAAAAWWHAAGAPYEEALARTDASDLDRVREGIERLDLLGASASADRVRRDLRQRGVVQLPVRPRTSTLANPAGLTNRQLDVARLVARGFTNAEIANRLYISPKTTDHHVSAVLTKLGMPSRRSVVVQAAELGLS